MEDDDKPKTDPPADPPHVDPPADPPHVDPPAVHDPRVDSLATKVDELSTMVQDLLQKGEQDTTPVHRPWTHAGSHR